jgi:PAS domain S-box-containing protein
VGDFLKRLFSSADGVARKQVQETENQFRTLAESIPHLVWMADQTGHIFWYNRRWYQYTGTTFEQMQGWGWKTVHDPNILPQVMKRWEGAIASGTPFEMTFPLRGADGEFRTFLTRIEPIRDESGSIVRWFGTNTDVNDNEKLRNKAESSEEKLRSFIEADSQGMLGISADGRISLVNRRTEEMFGYSRAELLGQSLEILLPERFAKSHVAHRREYFAAPRVRAMGAGMDLAARRKDGTEFPIEIGLSHVNTPEGPLAFGVVRDISERRRTEAELLASENKLRSFVEAASEAILGVSPAGRILLVNRRTEEMFGYARAELLGLELEALVPERFRATHAVQSAGFFSRPRVRHMGTEIELAGLRKDGTEFPADIGLTHVSTPDGPMTFAMVKDVTDVKKTAEELQRVNSELRRSNAELAASEEKFRACFEGASQPILGVSTDGRIILVNRRTEEMFGYSREELLGEPMSMLYPERRAATYRARVERAFVDPTIWFEDDPSEERVFLRKDGTEFPYTAGISNVDLPEGPLLFAMINDVSASKKAADELKRVNEELRRSYTELEQFAHVASHDLQEPLRMVTSYLQLIERRYNDHLDDDGREFIHFAVDGAKRMKALIKDLLAFSRTGSDTTNRQAVEAGSVLEHALSNLKTAIDESGAQITIDSLPVISVDPVLFTQVFQNLIANAIKFQNNTVPRVHISAHNQAAAWIFSVQDNGIGIEPHHRDRIFRIFERLHTSEQYSGSGIGLAITRKIVERHGGRIWVESQPGTGSTFHFSLSTEMAVANPAAANRHNQGAKTSDQ